jgi:hypothetical protein
MSVVALSPGRLSESATADGAPVLHWMIFTGACVFAAVVLWRYNLIQLMVVSDRTYISSIIAVLYIAASLHCLWRTITISREGVAGRRTADQITAGRSISPPAARMPCHPGWSPTISAIWRSRHASKAPGA